VTEPLGPEGLRLDRGFEAVTPDTPVRRLVLPAVPGKDVMLALVMKLPLAVPKPEPETLLVPLPENTPVEKPELCEEGSTLEALEVAIEEANVKEVAVEVIETEVEGKFEEPEKVADDTCEPDPPAVVAEVKELEVAEEREVKVDDNPPEADTVVRSELIAVKANEPDRVPVPSPIDVANEVSEVPDICEPVAPANVAEVNEPETAEGKDVKVDENPPVVDSTAEPDTPERILVAAETNEPDKALVSNPDDVAKAVIEASPDDVAEEVIEANPDDVPSESVEAPDDTPEDTPDDPIEIPLETPDDSPEKTPDEVPETADVADPESDEAGDAITELMMEVPKESVTLAPRDEIAVADEGMMDVATEDMMEDVATDGSTDDVATDDGRASDEAVAAIELVAGKLAVSTPVEVGIAIVLDTSMDPADTEVAIAESRIEVPLDTRAFVAPVE
jgi:hypothetical protein